MPMVRKEIFPPERAPVGGVPPLRSHLAGRYSGRREKSVSEYGAEILATSERVNVRRDGKPRVRGRVPLAHIANGVSWTT